MRRLWPWLTLVLMVLVVLHPLVTFDLDGSDDPSDPDPATVSRFDAIYALDESGDLEVTETIEVRFPEGEVRRGIFRFFDEEDPNEPRADRTPRLKVVTRDGEREPYEWSTASGGRQHVLRIGDADTTLAPGTYTYVLRYEVDHVLLDGSGEESGARFDWDVVPGGSLMAVERARVTLRLPESPGDVQCLVGRQESAGCSVSSPGAHTLVLSAADLEPGTPVTVRVALPGIQRTDDGLLPWSLRWSKVLGTDLPYAALVAALVLYAGWWGHRLARRTHEDPVEALAQHAPPAGLGPHQALYVSTEKLPRRALTASLLLAAEKGAVTLSEEGKDWTVTGTGSAVGLDPVTARILRHLGVHEGGQFVVRHKDASTGATLDSVHSAAEEETKRWALEERLVEKSGPGLLGAFGVVAAFVAFGALVLLGMPSTSVALAPGAFAALGLPMLYVGARTRRTEQGRQLWARVEGFRQVLSTGQERLDASDPRASYAAHLPWAVAFGCADDWLERFPSAAGEEQSDHHLYGAGAGLGALAVAAPAFLDSFDSAVSSAISAHQSSQSSSDSGSSSSGGGGGGGGMGSW